VTGKDDYFHDLAVKAFSTANTAMEKMNSHEQICADRYKALQGWLKTTFFTLLGACGFMLWYIIKGK
jgi:hypothetical protein